MLGPLLASLIFSGIIGFIISYVILKLSDIVQRFKRRQSTKTDTKGKLTSILGDPAYISTLTSIPIDDLEKLMGTEGLFEVPIINDKVDVDSIAILKTDEQEEKLSNILKSNGGVIKLTA